MIAIGTHWRYHLFPSRFFTPLGIILWWKTRHCIKVSIECKKVDIELMLGLMFGLIGILGVNSLFLIFIHEKFTVFSILAVYDLLVLNCFTIPAVNACAYLGEFLQSDVDLLNTVLAQINVSSKASSTSKKRKEELETCECLAEYFRHKIQTQERGPEIFGFKLTWELRSKLVTFAVIGLGGSAYKTGKHYLAQLMKSAAASTAHKAASHKIKSTETETKDVPEKVSGRRLTAPALRRAWAALPEMDARTLLGASAGGLAQRLLSRAQGAEAVEVLLA